MVQIKDISDNQEKQELFLDIDEPGFDFTRAKQVAKEKAVEICDYPMILSWKNSDTGETNPDYECGVSERPFWIRYAEGRGANLTIDFNNGRYVFMILKM